MLQIQKETWLFNIEWLGWPIGLRNHTILLHPFSNMFSLMWVTKWRGNLLYVNHFFENQRMAYHCLIREKTMLKEIQADCGQQLINHLACRGKIKRNWLMRSRRRYDQWLWHSVFDLHFDANRNRSIILHQIIHIRYNFMLLSSLEIVKISLFHYYFSIPASDRADFYS